MVFIILTPFPLEFSRFVDEIASHDFNYNLFLETKKAIFLHNLAERPARRDRELHPLTTKQMYSIY